MINCLIRNTQAFLKLTVMENNIPKSVMHEATSLIDLYGSSFKYLGEYMGTAAYCFVFPENTVTGFPFIFLHNKKDDRTDVITGFDALDIIAELIKE